MTTPLRTYSKRPLNQDTGIVRWPLLVTTLTGVGTLAFMRGGDWLALGVGCTAGVFMAVWRVIEHDQRSYEIIEAAPPSEDVRPMEVIRGNPAGRTIAVARWHMDEASIKALGKAAMRNGGKITRDVLQAASLPRDVYQETGRFQDELVRVGYATRTGRDVYLTPRGVDFTRNPTAPAPTTMRQRDGL